MEDIIREDELETALQVLLAVGDSLSDCEVREMDFRLLSRQFSFISFSFLLFSGLF